MKAFLLRLVAVLITLSALACWSGVQWYGATDKSVAVRQQMKPSTTNRRIASTGFRVDADSNDIGGALLRYQMALDEIGRGHLSTARVVLEGAIRQYGDRPELNLLLTYVLQRQGRGADAQKRAEAVAASSPLAAAWAQQLKLAENDSEAGATPLYTRQPSANSGVRVAQPDNRLWTLEQDLSQLVNKERQNKGLASLVYDPDLSDVARAHSIEMRDKKYFSHISPTAALHEPLTRYELAFHSTPRVVAENIYDAWGIHHTLAEKDIQLAHDSFMHSPGHRANILYPDVQRIGIGIASNANGDIWVTEMFAAS